MEVVIDIPENVYNYLKQEWVKVPEDNSVINQIMYGILHGTVLPEGHSRLIEEDAALNALRRSGYLDIHAIWYYKDIFKNVKTIIPADKEDSNESGM